MKYPNKDQKNVEIILIVGGAGGIGSAIVKKFSTLANTTIIVGDKDASALKNLQEQYDTVSSVYTHVFDVCDTDSLQRFVKEIESEYGHVTHVISLAGGALHNEFNGLGKTSMHTIAASIKLNLESHIVLVKLLLPLLSKNTHTDRSVTLVSSVNAIRDFGLPVYSAAKAGLLGFVHAMTGELGAKGVRINAVLPGTTPTPRTLKEPKNFEALKHGTALGRLTTPKEISETIFALAYLMTATTGQYIIADCGQVVKK